MFRTFEFFHDGEVENTVCWQSIALRFVASTLVASGVDSMIFGSIAFYGLMASDKLFLLIMTMWFLKVLIEVLGLPISLWLTHQLKKVERLDIYDMQTHFNLFSLQVDYTNKQNRYSLDS